jgi:hypothetical protein
MTLPDVHELDAAIQEIGPLVSAGKQRPREATS